MYSVYWAPQLRARVYLPILATRGYAPICQMIFLKENTSVLDLVNIAFTRQFNPVSDSFCFSNYVYVKERVYIKTDACDIYGG